jgi:small subunit ribosomal protein S5e
LFETAPKLFGRFSYEGVEVKDPCFTDYIAVESARSKVYVPHTAGRYQAKTFRKAQCPIVERLAGALLFHGRNTGKKAQAIRIIRHAFEIIQLLTGKNPLIVFIEAVRNSGPREDATRLGNAGVVRKQAVDVSPLRRVNQAIFFIAHGTREHAFKSMKSIAECLSDEIIAAANNNAQNSWAIR